MSCSNPIRLYKSQLKPSLRKNHSDFELNALRKSFNECDYIEVPCRYCLNCRVDRQNELVDRAEYEYINYGCGAFVTLTYDDYHNQKNSFIDSHTGELTYTINKKDGKDFLNRLNKLVHQDNKKTGFNPLCRKDYKYIITHEYGDKFGRNHIHILFFGLDFAYCERLFWRAWQYQGGIEVGAIKNGGIEYVTKYISEQTFGLESFFKYNYHHQQKPCSSHSLGFGEGLYKSQLNYIKEHDGCYHWHGKDKPVPIYYKNKYLITSDKDIEKYEKKYKQKCKNIYYLYQHKITSFKDFQAFTKIKSQTRQKNLEIKLSQQGKQIYNGDLIQKELHDMIWNDNHRINPKNDKWFSKVIRPDGTFYLNINNKSKNYLTTRDLMKLGTDIKHLKQMYGIDTAYKMIGMDIPF